jgi:iron complex outermembrane receptor protein
MTFRKKLALAALAALVVSLPLGAAQAQDEPMIEEIIVTGSAIARPDLDNALPVQVFNEVDIFQTGVTNTPDLIAKMPAMQNPYTDSDSVGGGGGGIRTANLRGIGDQYTLSLVNGRRIAPADSGSTIDISNIPVAMLDRVELLTDGASALYGSDAIAGVVNFVMKEEVDKTTIALRGDQPEHEGGENWNFDLVSGFGSVDADGYGVVFSYSHDEQKQLASADRGFAETGFVHFTDGGQSYYFQNSSTNAIPANAYLRDDNGELLAFNPYFARTGSCAEHNTPQDQICGFDYTSTLEVLPEHERDSIYVNGTWQATDQLKLFGNVFWSDFTMITRIAPYPTGQFPLPIDSDLVQTEVMPYAPPDIWAQTTQVRAAWRALPGGNRTTKWNSSTTSLTLGGEYTMGEAVFSGALVHSIGDMDQSFPTGWLLLDEFVSLSQAGAFNVFATPEDFTDSDVEALAPAIYHGPWDYVKNTMTTLDGKVVTPVFGMAGGDAMLAAGFDYRTTEYKRSIADANANEELLFLSPDTPYALERGQWGLFGELLMPITESLEVTGSVRYDDVDPVEDKLNGSKIDKGDDEITGKISAMYRFGEVAAIRGSYGTGFKAPSMREIGEPRSDFGVTSGNFLCPFDGSIPDPRNLGALCQSGEQQFNVYREGYAGLFFERSEQYTFGVVLTPWQDFSATVDYWNIKLEDLVERLTESQIVDNPVQYYDLFTTKANLATGDDEIAIIQAAVNVGSKEQRGIDYAINQGFDLNWGYLNLRLQGTYIDKSVSSLTGSSLGQFGNDNNVVFENKLYFQATLDHGNFSHSLRLNYQSGYDDQEQIVEVTGTGVPLGEGPEEVIRLKVDSYTTVDYQLNMRAFDDVATFTFGVTNLGDEEPPLSLRDSGAGHQVGWDPRYFDAYGRTFYLRAEVGF